VRVARHCRRSMHGEGFAEHDKDSVTLNCIRSTWNGATSDHGLHIACAQRLADLESASGYRFMASATKTMELMDYDGAECGSNDRH
jgi:hypothetical protein